MYPPAEKRFLFVNFLTIISLFLVITAGGVVRSTGAGMGCPDWPTCFGKIIPPTHISELPEDYQQHYVEGRQAKNDRFSKTLDKLGFSELAGQIRHDPSISDPQEFNAVKTWTEYINRLFGVIAGFFLLLSAFFSFTFLKGKKSVFVLSVLNVFLVGFQGWLGSIVVSTNLMPWLITVHMMLALVIVGISIYTYFKVRSMRDKDLLINRSSMGIKWLAFVSLILILLQVVFGTEVREHVDRLGASASPPDRSGWIGLLGAVLDYHRILAYLSALVVLILFYLIRSGFAKGTYQSFYSNVVVILVFLQFVTGYVLYHFALPPFAQTSHLVLASLLFGAQYYLMLLLGRANR